MDEFEGHSCFKIVHSVKWKRLWKSTRSTEISQRNVAYNVHASQPICERLW